MLSSPSCLFGNAEEKKLLQGVAWFAVDSNSASFQWMCELPVASPRSYLYPSVFLQHAYNLFYLVSFHDIYN